MIMYLIESERSRDILVEVMKKLYLEKCLTGDEMRDMAQLINYVLDNLVEVNEGDFK
jgi:hypothetical protein